METATLLALIVGLLAAGAVYVALEYRSYGQRHDAQERLLRLQTEAHAIRKELQGYTQHAEHLTNAKTALADGLKATPVKVTREYVFVEKILQEPLKTRVMGAVVVRYAVDYVLEFDLKAHRVDLNAESGGLEIQVDKPVLRTPAQLRPLSHEVLCDGPLPNEPATLAAINAKLPSLVTQYGAFVASDDAVLATCREKVADTLRQILAAQPGVKHLPLMVVKFK